MFSVLVQRRWFSDKAVIGELSINGSFECYSLELPLSYSGTENVQGKTCIPAGSYALVIDYSTRFQRLMPHILDIPNRSAIRIHMGNDDVNTEGCLLVGVTYTLPDWVGESTAAFASFYNKLSDALAGGDQASITITNEPMQAAAAPLPLDPSITAD